MHLEVRGTAAGATCPRLTYTLAPTFTQAEDWICSAADVRLNFPEQPTQRAADAVSAIESLYNFVAYA
ncbi:MAG: hypothetical protein WBC92_17730 [Terracidiphilus sp.]